MDLMLISPLSWWVPHNINSADCRVHHLKKGFQADMISTLFYCFGSLTTCFAFLFCAIRSALGLFRHLWFDRIHTEYRWSHAFHSNTRNHTYARKDQYCYSKVLLSSQSHIFEIKCYSGFTPHQIFLGTKRTITSCYLRQREAVSVQLFKRKWPRSQTWWRMHVSGIIDFSVSTVLDMAWKE